MIISTSILSVKDNLKNAVDLLDNTNTDYIHLDIMDGMFVENTTWQANDLLEILQNNHKPLDIHFMVNDVKGYVDSFRILNPTYMTFHLEAIDNVLDMINYIKGLGIKVGLAIKPSTKVEEIYEYLPFIDMVLVMSVNPGSGGQPFMLPSIDKINNLREYKTNNNLNYIINVDGGINDNTIKLIRNADMAVAGSYITNNDYNQAINTLKNI